jgi:ferric-dicitrate binding protein FerR (iron transport regulator)
MTRFAASPKTCERVRTWVSLGLDGELSELERALLDAHLARCQDCVGFAKEVGAATRELRAAELERPARPIAVPGRRRSRRPMYVPAAAAAMALAVGLGVLVESLGSSPRRQAPSAVRANKAQLNPVTSGENVLLREIRLAYMEAERARMIAARQPGLGMVV